MIEQNLSDWPPPATAVEETPSSSTTAKISSDNSSDSNPCFLNTLLETIPNPIFYKNRDGVYTGCNRAFEEITGCSRRDIIGKTVMDIGSPEIAEEYKRKDDELFANPGTQTYEWRVKRTDGTVRDVIFNKATFVDEYGGIAGLVGVILDITEHRKLEREIITVSSREQQHFGRTLHDTLGQILSGIAFQAKALSNSLSHQCSDTLGEQAEKIATLANSALSQSRRIAHGLSPVDMIEQGLSVALNQLAEGVAELYDIQCEFVADRHASVYDNDTATHLYYIAREAVNNALRHGKATRIIVALEVDDTHGTLSIVSNGRNMANKPDDPTKKGMGLCIMRYRAEVIRGNLHIGVPSNMPSGVAITCRFPNQEYSRTPD